MQDADCDGELLCIDYNDDQSSLCESVGGTSLGSIVTLENPTESVYFIAVTGLVADSVGDFELRATCQS